jgi:hypothetical protein
VTEQVGELADWLPDAAVTAHTIVLNTIPASAAPPAKLTGTVTDWPAAIGDIGGFTGVTTGVKVTTIETDAGFTLPERVVVVSWTDPPME